MTDNCNKTDFPRLDTKGIEYYRWVSDVKIALIGKVLLKTIIDPPRHRSSGTLTIDPPPPSGASLSRDDGPTDEQKALALGFLRHHIDPHLKWEYIHVEDPKELWTTLQKWFLDINNIVIPALKSKWHDLRFIDFKCVADYNAEVLQLRAKLQMCNVKLTEAELLEKTLSTFPLSARDTARNYRWEIDNDWITTYAELINAMGVAEQQDELLVQQNSSRPVGTKRVPESSYALASKKGKVQNNAAHGKKPCHRGPLMGRGANKWHCNAPPSRPLVNARQDQVVGPRDDGPRDSTSNLCGYTGHWYKQCKASKELAQTYKAYKEFGRSQVHNVEVADRAPNAVLNVEDFTITQDAPDIMDGA